VVPVSVQSEFDAQAIGVGVGVAAATVHVLATHESPLGQALPQVAQLFGSLVKSVHPVKPPQSVCPVVLHWQIPL
jgi:hypothetical protein